MPKTINNADAAQALVRAYALKGRVDLRLDETIVPVAIVDNLGAEGTPLELRPCAGSISAPQVALDFPYVGVQTQAGFALSISEFIVANDTTVILTVFLKAFSAANLATIGISAASLVALDLPKDVTVVGSQTWFGTHTAEVGVLAGTFRVPANTSLHIPVGGTIYGIDNPQRVAFGLQVSVINRALTATARCVERDEE